VQRRSLLLAASFLTAMPIVAHAAQPKVVATFSVLGDMVQRIAGNRISLTVIVGPDGDCETYEPTAADTRALADADLLVIAAAGTIRKGTQAMAESQRDLLPASLACSLPQLGQGFLFRGRAA
jgi:ABC-type Zn uptake system ZnuABC Zn-binding protein ZnuA